MAGSGLQNWIHGGQPNPRSNRAPMKLIVAEEALERQRYTGVEQPNQESYHGAFSTDLESYPDTSSNDTQQQFVILGNSQAPVGPKQQNGPRKYMETESTVSADERSVQGSADLIASLRDKKTNPTAPLGLRNTQNFEEFDATWEKDQNDLAELGLQGNSASAWIKQLKPDHARAMISKPVDNSKGEKATTFKPNSTTVHRNSHNDLTVPQVHHRFAAKQQKSRADNISTQETAVQIPPAKDKTISHNQHNSTQQPVSHRREDNTEKSISGPQEVAVKNRSTQTTDLRNLFNLKRKKSLSEVEIGVSDARLMALPYSAIESEERSTRIEIASTTEPDDLDQWIASIVSDDCDEESIFTKMKILSDDQWADLGDILADEHNKIIDELKNLRNEKRKVSTMFEQEVGRAMEQVQTNDRIVESRLLKLRSYGAQMLNGESVAGAEKG